jgi:hypothetical protein
MARHSEGPFNVSKTFWYYEEGESVEFYQEKYDRHGNLREANNCVVRISTLKKILARYDKRKKTKK